MEHLFVFAPRAQKLAIAAAHKRDAAPHQTDRPIAKIVRLPSVIGDALLAEQCLGYDAITAAVMMRVERADRGTQAFAALFG